MSVLPDISGNRVKKIRNPWIKEQEELLADWSDIAQCYRWLHDRAYKLNRVRYLAMSIPVVVLSTLSGAASVSFNSIVGDSETSKKWVPVGIGIVSLLTGVMQTLSGTFGFAQLSEGHRVASIAWGKLQRKIAVEIQLDRSNRMDPIGFLGLCRQEMDRLIEQSPTIPESVIASFDKEFDKKPNLKQPDICGGIERTRIFTGTQSRSLSRSHRHHRTLAIS